MKQKTSLIEDVAVAGGASSARDKIMDDQFPVDLDDVKIDMSVDAGSALGDKLDISMNSVIRVADDDAQSQSSLDTSVISVIKVSDSALENDKESCVSE